MPEAARQLILPLGAEPELRDADRRLEPERRRLLQDASSLADRLSRLLEERVRLTVTENTSTMVSFRRSRSAVAFRVHAMFLDAPPDVVKALAEYAAGARGRSGALIDGWVRRNEEKVRVARAERQSRGLVPSGQIHDLAAILFELNRTHFDGKVEARIGWGREAPDRRRRSIKMGTYFHDAQVIRVHPALDRVEVPDFFVRFIVFHEMLHQVIPPRLDAGRRLSHPPEFRRRERAYPDHARALAWERRHLPLLLGRRPRRRPFDPEDPLG